MVLFTKKVINLKLSDFNNKKLINKTFKNKPGLIMFGTNWCGHCQMTKPAILSLADIGKKDFIVAAVDCDEQTTLSDIFEIVGFPTLMNVSKDGTLSSYNYTSRDLTTLVQNMCKTIKNKNKMCK